METTEVIIARLVLGYLKEEKCRTAYKEFLKTSRHLENDPLTRTKYLPTRFVGLTLEDILTEYFEISRIIQGRLEVTNYYNECHSRSSLVQQLLYLLSKSQSSRTSTPCPRSPFESNLDETSPSHIDHISDVETTPAHALPGNVRCTSEDSYLYKTPRKKSNSKLSKSATVSSVQIADKEDMSEVLAQTLLENKEFHEKIAQTINKVAEKQFRMSSELDRTIKTVVEETEADPMFDKILDEIIGSTTAIENCRSVESSSSTSSTVKDATDNIKSKRTQQRSASQHSMGGSENFRIRSDSQMVEHQNEEAIRSIVANSKNGNHQEFRINNDVVIFDGSLDKYLISNSCSTNTQTQSLQNPLYINTTGSLLMVPSGITSNRSLQIDPTKQYYLINKQPTMNWNIPQTKTPNLTEQDILAMPTVIVNDERPNILTPSETTSENCVTNKQEPTVQKILPKPIIEIPAEYLNVNKGNDSQQQSGLKNVIYPKKTKQIHTKETTAITKTCETTKTKIISDEKKSLPGDLHEEPEEHPHETTGTSQINTEKVTNNELITPQPLMERVQRTPKNGSHIRNLDFSSPPKITSTHKKSHKTKSGNKSPPFIHKKQAAKAFKAQSSLPSDRQEASRDVKEFKNKTSKIWDADLRAIAQPVEEEEKSIPTKKKKTPVKKAKKGKKSEVVKKKLNNTENDVALIEAALQTPIKSENEKCEKLNAVIDDHDEKLNVNIHKEENNSNTDDNLGNPVLCKNINSSKKLAEQSGHKKDTDECSTNKTVLSPSKLNANKRELVSSDNTDINVISGLTKSEETSKFVTPEMSKEHIPYPIKANRNITSMFETPLKSEPLPKTPGIQTPNTSLSTPFTKMLEANLRGIDISSLPTPSIPITPNFPPFTPNIEMSPYSNRPTDYSTSSSYYQPSDSEPNRSLEANVIELEKQPVTVLSNVVILKDNVEASPQDNQLEGAEKKIISVNSINSALTEHVNIFNRNVIGKKNLNLMERHSSSSSTSSSSDDSSSESCNESKISSCSWMEKSNETVIYNNKKPVETPKRTYSLRNRTIINNTKEVPVKITTIASQDVVSKKQVNKELKTNARKGNSIHKDGESQVGSKHEKLIDEKNKLKENKTTNNEVGGIKTKLTENSNSEQRLELKKELNEKLLRTINKIKNIEKPVVKKNLKSSKATSKFMKIRLSNITKSKKKTKSGTLKKAVQNMKHSDICDITNADNKIVRDRNKSNRPKAMSNVQITKDLEKNDKSASDIEAQNLIEGLKERELDKNPDFSNMNCTTKDIENTSTEEDIHERSTSELETEWREIYDTQVFEGPHECVVFNYSKKISKTFEDFDIKVLEKTFTGKVFIEEINEEIDVPVGVSPFYNLLDIPPLKDFTQKLNTSEKNKADDKKTKERSGNKHFTSQTEINKTKAQDNTVSDVHKNEACADSLTEDRDESEFPSVKKRKIEKDDYHVPEEKDCKTLLQQINVDTFLNNIYGKS